MKTLLTMLACCTVLSAAFGQKLKETDVPVSVKGAFYKAYPSVKSVKWGKENDKFEASFDNNKEESSVVIDNSGAIVETEVEINVGQLPKEVNDYVKTHYQGQKIKEAARISDANGVVTFEAELKGVELLFTDKGEFIKEVKE